MVRPNQGLIEPNKTEQVQILLVEKDKNTLLQSYQRLGQTALDHSKDKFLIQSCTVTPAFTKEYQAAGSPDAGYDKLSAMWTTVTANSSSSAIANKKLHVRHTVQEGDDSNNKTAASQMMPTKHTPAANLSNMSNEQLLQEITNLRRKYDELVAFSVNLTAERDILNNTLEQTKRDLNRELTKSHLNKTATGGKGGGASDMATHRGGSAFTVSRMIWTVVVAMLFFLLGIKYESHAIAVSLKETPILGPVLSNSNNDNGEL